MVMLLNQTITGALANQVGNVLQIRGGPGSAQLPDGLVFQATFTYGSGGTSVNAWLQTSIDGELTWCDAVSFTQFATASARLIGSVTSTTALAMAAATDGTLAAGTVNAGLIGPKWRVKWTSVGTYAGGTTLRVDAYTDGLVLAPSSGG